jgi:hypothetical protein
MNDVLDGPVNDVKLQKYEDVIQVRLSTEAFVSLIFIIVPPGTERYVRCKCRIPFWFFDRILQRQGGQRTSYWLLLGTQLHLCTRVTARLALQCKYILYQSRLYQRNVSCRVNEPLKILNISCLAQSVQGVAITI